jgi:hypothetical protein
MGPIGCPETSVQNYHSTVRNIPEERRALFWGGGVSAGRFLKKGGNKGRKSKRKDEIKKCQTDGFVSLEYREW